MISCLLIWILIGGSWEYAFFYKIFQKLICFGFKCLDHYDVHIISLIVYDWLIIRVNTVDY